MLEARFHAFLTSNQTKKCVSLYAPPLYRGKKSLDIHWIGPMMVWIFSRIENFYFLQIACSVVTKLTELSSLVLKLCVQTHFVKSALTGSRPTDRQ